MKAKDRGGQTGFSHHITMDTPTSQIHQFICNTELHTHAHTQGHKAAYKRALLKLKCHVILNKLQERSDNTQFSFLNGHCLLH